MTHQTKWAEAKLSEVRWSGDRLTQDQQLLVTPYPHCPLCESTALAPVGVADCRRHEIWHPPLPETLGWLRCAGCDHVFTEGFYTEAGLAELFRKANPGQLAGGDPERQRLVWAPVVRRVLETLACRSELFRRSDPPAPGWLDVGCGAGGLIFTAAEFGFAAVGLDLRQEAVRRLQDLGYQARCGDIFADQPEQPFQVVSMADLLEHTPYPKIVLARARELLAPEGSLFVSCPNRECASWREMDRKNANPYWMEIEHHHNFSRRSLLGLLTECGFRPVDYSVSQRYIACMEIVAVRR